ncbi:glycosyltransferase family 39 protein [candidate division WOR-3 bacterium]|nr:glycosyltransferase family 39 protein [candidate division WOR-3 bacterium]
MVHFKKTFDERWLFYFFISLIFSLLILFFLSVLLYKFNFTRHVTFNYYIHQLFLILPFLPLSLLLFSILPLRRFLDYSRLIDRFRITPFLLSLFFISFIITNLISFFFYDHIPQGDSVSTFFQARIFSNGNLWVVPPQFPEFFLKEMVIHNGKWFSMVQHGHSVFLTPFILSKIPWLLGPLFGSFSLIIFFLFLKNCFGERTAKEGALFLLLSPTFLFITSSYLNQNSSFFLILLSLFFLSCYTKQKNRLFPFLSGLFSGLAFFSRTTACIFIPAMLVLLIVANRNRDEKIRAIFFFLIGFLLTFSIQFIHNALYTGNVFRFGYALHSQSSLHKIGFGIGKGAATFNIHGHTPFKAIVNLFYNLFTLSLHLYGWPLLSLLFIPFAFLRWKRNLWDFFAILVIILSVIFFSLYWFHGISPMGPKYYFAVVPLLVLLTVRGIRKLNIRPLISLLFIFSILIYIPSGLRIFNSVWGTNLNCYNKVKRKSVHNAIVFIKDLPGRNEYEKTINRHNYLSVAFRNHPILDKGDIIYAKDLGAEKNIRLINEYKERKPYLFEYIDKEKKWKLLPYTDF